jgi:hypothetical protein
MPTNLRKLDELIELAGAETNKIRALSQEEKQTWIASHPFIPPNVPLGNGGHVFTTAEALVALREYGRRWRRENAKRRRLIGEQKVEDLAISVYGEILKRANENFYPNDAEIKPIFDALLQERLSALTHSITHYFPCQIFDEANLPPFEVGPVRFVSREAWLHLVQTKAGKPLSWIKAVEDHWAGRGEVPRPTPDAAQQADDRWTAWTVVDAVGSCIWMATVDIPAREYRQSRACAEAAVRLAIDTIALPLTPQTARLVRYSARDARPHLTRFLMQAEGKELSSESTIDLPSLRGPPGSDKWLVDQTTGLREWAGAAIQTLVQMLPSSPISELHQRWLDAMYWFGQSRREPIEFIGLVEAGICLDILANGSKDSGIINLCCALFSLQHDSPVLNDGTTLKSLVTTIYKEGRSQISHDGRPSLLRDLPIPRDEATFFVAHVVCRYIEGLHRYGGPDGYEHYLSALPSLFPVTP